MLRSPPERLIQSLLFETGGLIAVVPLYDHFRPTHGQQDRRPHGISR